MAGCYIMKLWDVKVGHVSRNVEKHCCRWSKGVSLFLLMKVLLG